MSPLTRCLQVTFHVRGRSTVRRTPRAESALNTPVSHLCEGPRSVNSGPATTNHTVALIRKIGFASALTLSAAEPAPAVPRYGGPDDIRDSSDHTRPDDRCKMHYWGSISPVELVSCLEEWHSGRQRLGLAIVLVGSVIWSRVRGFEFIGYLSVEGICRVFASWNGRALIVQTVAWYHPECKLRQYVTDSMLYR